MGSTPHVDAATIEVLTVETTELGDRGYLVTDGEVAAVVDPQRDVGRLLALAEARGVRITHVFETHIHNDYVSGGLELSRRVGADYVVNAAEEVDFDRRGIEPGERVDVGAFSFEALHTPGHTPTHLSYVLREGNETVAVFTGGSLLYGAVGRTDLIAADLTQELTRQQYRSARRIVEAVPASSDVLPTHGFGSFCSSEQNQDTSEGTVHDEQHRNPALTTDDEDEFVADIIESYDVYPSYYAHMGPLNRAGPQPIDLSIPPSLDAAELGARIDARHWVVDVRDRVSFAIAHRPGTINIELGAHFSTYAGWIIPWGSEITLVGVSDSDVAEARLQLARIGYDEVTGKALGPAAMGTGRSVSYRVVGFRELHDELDRSDVVVLDVRRDGEWKFGHVPGALHVHLPELRDRLDEVPEREVWVHCGSGYRAAIAASILDQAGRRVVLIDDDWDNAADAGIDVVVPEPVPA